MQQHVLQEDLGFVYNQPGSTVILGNEAQAMQSGGGPGAEARGGPYEPSTGPGCRLPHVELRAVNRGGLILQ